MYSTIPKEWRGDFNENVTVEELNDRLVQLHIPTIVLISLFMFVGLLGNISVLCIYTNYKASTYKSFIIWLGWMDLLACLVGKPALIVSMLYPYMSPSEVLCRWSRFLHVFVSSSAALIFLAISYERYKKICFMDMHQLSYKRVNLVCLLAAISACVVAVPALFVFGNASVDTGVHNITGVECFIDQTYKSSYFPRLYFLFQLLLCLVSFSMMCIFYVRIWKTLRWHRSFIHDHTFKPKAHQYNGSELNGTQNVSTNDLLLDDLTKTDQNSRENGVVETEGNKDLAVRSVAKPSHHCHKPDIGNFRAKSQENLNKSQRNLLSVLQNDTAQQAQNLHTKEITKMLFIVTVVFILAFLPHLVLMIMNSIRPQSLKNLSPGGVVVYTIFLRTFVINNMANPIVYFICLRSFRTMCSDNFRKLCKCFSLSKNGTV